jgi:hypothetical protein
MGAATAGRRLFRGDRLLLPLVIIAWSFLYGFVYVGDGRYHFALIPAFCLLAASFVWGPLPRWLQSE